MCCGRPAACPDTPPPSESVHDLVENSHASTALSYSDGLAKARQLAGQRDRAEVVVIGDRAMTGGTAREAPNDIGGAPDRPVIVVLNDSGRPYTPTTGALADHLEALTRGDSPQAALDAAPIYPAAKDAPRHLADAAVRRNT